MTDELTHLGEAISTRRRELGLSQAELSRRAKVDRSSLVQYEAGRNVPTLPILMRLAGALGWGSLYDVAAALDRAVGRRPRLLPRPRHTGDVIDADAAQILTSLLRAERELGRIRQVLGEELGDAETREEAPQSALDPESGGGRDRDLDHDD